MTEIIVSIISIAGVLVPAFLLHKREVGKIQLEMRKHISEKKEYKIKTDVLDKVLEFSSFNMIKDAVDEIFEMTKADRFLILIAVNGKVDFNIVSVIFEQHKSNDYKVNAIARYRSLSIDEKYRLMLKNTEKNGTVCMVTSEMEDSLLKNIYEIEGVKFSSIRHILRSSVDDDNDILVYSSIATHVDRKFTKLEKTKIDIMYDSRIKPIIKAVIE